MVCFFSFLGFLSLTYFSWFFLVLFYFTWYWGYYPPPSRTQWSPVCNIFTVYHRMALLEKSLFLLNFSLHQLVLVLVGPSILIPTYCPRYDPTSCQWSVETVLPSPRFHAGVTRVGGLVFIIGGFRDDDMFDRATGVTGTSSRAPSHIKMSLHKKSSLVPSGFTDGPVSAETVAL